MFTIHRIVNYRTDGAPPKTYHGNMFIIHRIVNYRIDGVPPKTYPGKNITIYRTVNYRAYVTVAVLPHFRKSLSCLTLEKLDHLGNTRVDALT